MFCGRNSEVLAPNLVFYIQASRLKGLTIPLVSLVTNTHLGCDVFSNRIFITAT